MHIRECMKIRINQYFTLIGMEYLEKVGGKPKWTGEIQSNRELVELLYFDNLEEANNFRRW